MDVQSRRKPEHLERFIRRLKAIKTQYPMLRIGQIILNAVHERDLFNIEDDDLAFLMERALQPTEELDKKANEAIDSFIKAGPEGFAYEEECKHSKVMPSFDEKAAENLTEVEVRTRWPRFMGVCPDCQKHLILYASVEHQVYGDW